MTEAEWLACSDPTWMLRGPAAKTSERKLRLFLCACCRMIVHLAEDGRCAAALAVSERFTEGGATDEQLHAARREADAVFYDFQGVEESVADAVVKACDRENIGENAASAATTARYLATIGVDRPLLKATRIQLGRTQCRWLRDIVGNPFRPHHRQPKTASWHDETAQRLAHAIYEGRSFELLPILADALEDAGCAEADILQHLRGPGPHVRGCWALDFVLGKS